MKLSTRARYALRAMVVISREGKDGGPVNLGVVSDRTGVSRRYLEQVSIALKAAGLLKGVSGKNGGHLLGRPADRITLLEIVEAAIGPISVVDCANDPGSCSRSRECDCRSLYRLLNHRLSESLRAFTLADLASGRLRQAVEREIGLDPAFAGREK